MYILHSLCLLQAKLHGGDGCLSTAFPYDVATLIKQFCRELPEPLFPSELHAALLKAQALSNKEDRTSALQLLSCLLPARNSSCLHYLFNFLSIVSQRFDTNVGKLSSRRLSVQEEVEKYCIYSWTLHLYPLWDLSNVFVMGVFKWSTLWW